MNIESFKDQIDKINYIPTWIKTKEDAIKYAMHLHMRLIQSEMKEKNICQFLSEKFPDILSEIVNDPNFHKNSYDFEDEFFGVPVVKMEVL